MPKPWTEPDVCDRLTQVILSYRHWTGLDLVASSLTKSLAESVWGAPFALVAHGTEADPLLWYGNRTALELWEMDWIQFSSTPSRLTAEAPLREERARLLSAVTTQGFIQNYNGIRVTKTGRRFLIHTATVWNVLDGQLRTTGQAALFSQWEWLSEKASNSTPTT